MSKRRRKVAAPATAIAEPEEDDDTVVFMCEHCDVVFKTVAELRSPKGHKAHCEVRESIAKSYKCTECGQKFSSDDHLEQHRKHYHDEDNALFGELTEKKTKEKDQAPAVRISPRANKGEKYAEVAKAIKGNTRAKKAKDPVPIADRQCQWCQKVFEKAAPVRLHEKFCHKNDENLLQSCDYCKGTFQGNVALEVHMSRCEAKNISKKVPGKAGVLSSKKGVPVDDGAVAGTSSSGAPPVKKAKVDGEGENGDKGSGTTTGKTKKAMMLKCKQCDMLFNGHMDFINHMDLCKAKDLISLKECEYCGKEFKNYSVKIQHEKDCSENVEGLVTCFDCHLPVPTDEDCQQEGYCRCGIGQAFTCHYCTKKFTSMSLMTRHQDDCVENPDSQAYQDWVKKEEEEGVAEGERTFTPRKKHIVDSVDACEYCGMRNFKNEQNLFAHQKFCRWLHEQKVTKTGNNVMKRSLIQQQRNAMMRAQLPPKQPVPLSTMRVTSPSGRIQTVNTISPVSTGQIFVCSYCPAKFNTMWQLSQHLDVCAEDPDNREYVTQPVITKRVVKVAKPLSVPQTTPGRVPTYAPSTIVINPTSDNQAQNAKSASKNGQAGSPATDSQGSEPAEKMRINVAEVNVPVLMETPTKVVESDGEIGEDTEQCSKTEFLCKYCNSMFGNKKYFNSHLPKCKIIHKDLKAHRVTVEKDDDNDDAENLQHTTKKDECKSCGDTYSKDRYTHNDSGCSTEFTCTACGSVLSSREKLQEHIRECFEDKMIRGQVDGSLDGFEHPQRRRTRSEIDDLSPRTTPTRSSSTHIMCHYCSCTFGNAGALTMHERLCRQLTPGKRGKFNKVHVGELSPPGTYKCKFCKGMFGNAGGLTIHLKMCESWEKLPRKEREALRRAEQERRDRHAENLRCKMMGKVQIHKCEFCCEKFGNRGALFSHQRYCKNKDDHVNVKTLLEVKRQLMKGSSEVNEESEAENDEELDEKTCKYCDGNYMTIQARASHEKFCRMKDMSMSGPPFKCAYCKNHFENKSGLVNHAKSCKRKSHGFTSGDPNLMCGKCGEDFLSKGGLTTHQKFCKGPRYAPKRSEAKQAIEFELEEEFVPQGKVMCFNCKEEFGNVLALREHSQYCSIFLSTNGKITNQVTNDVGESSSVASKSRTQNDATLRYFFICPHCGSHYRNKQTLQYHIVACLSGVDYPRGEPDPAEVTARLAKERLEELELERQKTQRKSLRKTKKIEQKEEDKEYRLIRRDTIERENVKLKEQDIPVRGPRAAQRNRNPDKKVKFRSAEAVKKEKEMLEEYAGKVWICDFCGWTTNKAHQSLGNHKRVCKKFLNAQDKLRSRSNELLLTCDLCHRRGFHNLGSLTNHKEFCKWLLNTTNKMQKSVKNVQARSQIKPGRNRVVSGKNSSAKGKLSVKGKSKAKHVMSSKATAAKLAAKKAFKRKITAAKSMVAKKKIKTVKKNVVKGKSSKTVKSIIKKKDQSKARSLKKLHLKSKCQQKAKSKTQTKAKAKDLHQGIFTYQCQFCERMSNNKGAISQHMKYCFHRKGKTYGNPKLKLIKKA